MSKTTMPKSKSKSNPTRTLRTLDAAELEQANGGFVPLVIGVGVAAAAYFWSTRPAY